MYNGRQLSSISRKEAHANQQKMLSNDINMVHLEYADIDNIICFRILEFLSGKTNSLPDHNFVKKYIMEMLKEGKVSISIFDSISLRYDFFKNYIVFSIFDTLIIIEGKNGLIRKEIISVDAENEKLENYDVKREKFLINYLKECCLNYSEYKEVFLHKIRSKGTDVIMLKDYNQDLYDDKEVALEFFRLTLDSKSFPSYTPTSNFSILSNRLKADLDVVLAAIQSNCRNYKCLNEDLKRNPEIIEATLEALSKQEMQLEMNDGLYYTNGSISELLLKQLIELKEDILKEHDCCNKKK